MQVPSQFIIQQYPVIGHQPQLRRISTDCSSPPIKTANNNNILNINNNLNHNQNNYHQLNHNASNNSLLNNNSCNNEIPTLPNHNNNIDSIDTNSNNNLSLTSGVLGSATKRTMDDVLRKLTNKFRGSTIGGDGQRQPTPPPETR